MSIINKILQISKSTASSILNKEKPDALLDSDFFSESDKQYILNQITDKKTLEQRAELIRQIDKEEGWLAIKNKIKTPTKKLQIWKYAAAAAVLLFISGIIATQYIVKDKFLEQKNSITKISINPGTDKAILTLGNGKQISLGEGDNYHSENTDSNGKEIVYNNNVSGDTELNYLTTPKGGQFLIKLADGTKIWLNSDSKLKFPTAFVDGKPREVELVYGEAYFDVSHSTAHKGSHFKVLTGKQDIEVLGTEFNVKAYENENVITTTLVKGKIKISNGTETQALQPGDRSVLSRSSNNLKMSTVDIFNEVAWKEGVFSFQNMPLKDIMKVLERWYNVKTVFKNPAIENVTFNGILDKNQKIEDILAIINEANNTPYEIEQNTVIFK
ncbi:hypothetical protein BBH99_12940 [Chryseobacterium contaminans]|uniref:FecR family protein n=1 Tax=Chryseobacterium contaminans TaxID=1423959 RepID=A0A1M6Z281_9FLAO|nr:FecR family protein [Chryseobacterium contaminans]OCA72763.1 hypothetical protein BBH99_12940 [Chryseobacterium contaminans]SHL24482.1 FecR family protein [Chryseobacterium contaminans]